MRLFNLFFISLLIVNLFTLTISYSFNFDFLKSKASRELKLKNLRLIKLRLQIIKTIIKTFQIFIGICLIFAFFILVYALGLAYKQYKMYEFIRAKNASDYNNAHKPFFSSDAAEDLALAFPFTPIQQLENTGGLSDNIIKRNRLFSYFLEFYKDTESLSGRISLFYLADDGYSSKLSRDDPILQINLIKTLLISELNTLDDLKKCLKLQPTHARVLDPEIEHIEINLRLISYYCHLTDEIETYFERMELCQNLVES